MNIKTKIVSLAVLTAGTVCAMPTKQEIADTRPLVSELMAPAIADLKAKTKTPAEVADVSVGFAESAKSEAARYLFLRGAIGYYIRSSEFGKAADTVDALKAKVKAIPPSEVADIISAALGRENARKAPRLQSQLALAQAQVKAAKDVRRLAATLRQVKTDAVICQYAEALALTGNWKHALEQLAKASGSVGLLAKSEIDGSAKKSALGDFWWTYKTSYAGGEPVFRERAIDYYRKAIAAGEVDGLTRTLIEQRIASLALPDVVATPSSSQSDPGAADVTGRAVSTKPPSSVGSRVPRDRTVKTTSGIVHRWSFTDGFADSVGSTAPSKYGSAKAEGGFLALQSGSPIEFPAGTVPLAPFTVQAWASATDKGIGAGDDFIFKVAPSSDDNDNGVFWRWTSHKKWFSSIWGFGKKQNCYVADAYLLTGKPHLYTLTAEKDGKGMLLKFYRDDTVFGTMKTESAFKKPLMLILGGFVTPTYDEVRVYSRALSHAEIITSANEGPDKLPEGK